jgi:5-methyltetrahydrofolate--homocysteine methyltransferase
MGFTKNDVVVDGLVATVGAQKDAAINCLKTINYCYNNGLATICGLSNISFGLPERMFVNTAFLTMAISRGLTMAIANPSQTMLMNAAFASDMLLFKEESDVRYIENVKPLELASPGAGASGGKAGSDLEGKSQIYIDVLKGNKRSILDDVHAVLDSGADPQSIIDNDLIGAINEVGRLFEKKKYFLPQLIAGATAMDLAIEYITPLLHIEENAKPKGTVIMATVEGDIHDIGKNLVVLMLKNYGYKVVDLGKDVPLDKIIAAAKEEHADIIGLSALMTTTMMRMKDAVEYVRANNLPYKVIIGGAVVSQNFADEIGADGYSKDANEAVKLVDKLLTDK